MADKDSWWKDSTKGSGEKKGGNPFQPRTTTNNAGKKDVRSVTETVDWRIELFEKANVEKAE